MKNLIHVLIYFPIISFGQSQTVGLFQYDIGSFNGYTLFSPSEKTYLIDNCGRVVNSWESIYKPGNSVYLLEDGSLLRTCRMQSTVFSGGGIGGRVEKISWDNTLLWSYNFSNSDYHQHHDIEFMPTGNILILCWEYKSLFDAITKGRSPASLPDNELWPTYIMEVEPQGNSSINIVWEWHLWDHLIQDFDPLKPNYGVVADHPELLDINFYSGTGKKDWLHCNSIDYNAQLDQIVISSKKLSELYIIDHSTTTAEAATHNGGNSGMGGDILYRWGNPQAYDNGNTSNQQLFEQHNVHWIDQGLKDEGKLMIFNNGKGRGYSSIDIISTPLDGNNNYILSGNTFNPTIAEWIYTAAVPQDFYSSYISGCERLPNGNTLICDGAHGTFFEIDSNNAQVWKYINPVISTGALSQGDPIPTTNNGWTNTTFRCNRYAPSFPGFVGKDLSPGDVIELNPSPSSCEILSLDMEISDANKKLLWITDILGKKMINEKFNMPMIYIYSDGTVEKKIIIN